MVDYFSNSLHIFKIWGLTNMSFHKIADMINFSQKMLLSSALHTYSHAGDYGQSNEQWAKKHKYTAALREKNVNIGINDMALTSVTLGASRTTSVVQMEGRACRCQRPALKE